MLASGLGQRTYLDFWLSIGERPEFGANATDDRLPEMSSQRGYVTGQ